MKGCDGIFCKNDLGTRCNNSKILIKNQKNNLTVKRLSEILTHARWRYGLQHGKKWKYCTFSPEKISIALKFNFLSCFFNTTQKQTKIPTARAVFDHENGSSTERYDRRTRTECNRVDGVTATWRATTCPWTKGCTVIQCHQLVYYDETHTENRNRARTSFE